MEKISVVVITLNEEQHIAACLKSVRPFADDIIVLDSSSTDRTQSIAKRCGARVRTKRFDGYGAMKSAAVSMARHNLVFCIDADERASDELVRSVLKLKNGTSRNRAWTVSRLNWYLTGWLRHGGWYPNRNIRLFDRRVCGWTKSRVHETVRCSPGVRVGRLKGDLLHYTYPSISSHLLQIERFSTIAAQEKSAAGYKGAVMKMLFGPAATFLKSSILRAGWMDGLRGLTAARLSALSDFVKYAKVWETSAKSKRPHRG
jgi:glycosyltransferase involved in cell wall biosynthesis